jgi:hypothetical protein
LFLITAVSVKTEEMEESGNERDQNSTGKAAIKGDLLF